MPTLLGDSIFPADNPWNQQITNAPVAANSAAILGNITSIYGNGRLHPDFGQDTQSANPLYGIPYNVVHGNTTPKIHVVIDAYPGESDLQNVPMPGNPVIEGDQQNGPTVGLDARGDSHLIVFDVDNNVAYEFYRASRPSENNDGQWHADQESVWNMNTNAFRTIGWTSADAAGLAILPGLVRPDEGLPANEGGQGVIRHAIRFTLQNKIILDQFLYPASHVANSNTNAAIEPPMGARFRLKASVDISQLNPEARVVAQAMKDYGMIVADNGSNFYFSGASYSVNASNGFALTWNDNDIQDTTHGLKSLHFSDFEVVDLTPVVTGLGASAGSPGATLTVTGQNFTGAAGHLSVWFGATLASSVHIIDDSHLTVSVPAGSGTVDVRVQSGSADPGDTQNIKSPVFGYGTSAIVTADQFIFGAQAPTITSANHAEFLAGLAGSFTVTTQGGAPGPAVLSESGSLPTGVTFVDNHNGTATLSGTAASGAGGTYTLVITAATSDGAASSTQTFTLTVNPPGFSYNPGSQTLTITGNSFTFSQVTSINSGIHTTYTFTIDGSTLTLAASALAQVVVKGQGASTATLFTNDTYIGSDGLTHETPEQILLGVNNQLQKYDANGNPVAFLQMTGFATVSSFAGRADVCLITGSPGVQNVFVGAGSYAYMTSGNAFYYVTGAKYVYGYAAGPGDVSYNYDGSGASALVISGIVYNLMLGTDKGQSFFNEAVTFRYNYGVAIHPGQDVAYFYDSARNDVFMASAGTSYMYSANSDGTLAEYDQAMGFAQVYAYSFVGGVDYAYDYDPTHTSVTGFRRVV